MQSADSDYNPMEDPAAWDYSMQESHYDHTAVSSPPHTPKIKAHGLKASTAVASPIRGSMQRFEGAVPARPHGPGAEESFDVIKTFVKEKVCPERLR